MLFTDVAMNIAPDLAQKAQILENAVGLAHALGVERPKVAVIAAVETVNPEMPATVDAAALAKMADRGQIKGCVVDGPLALDNALSVEAARHKGIASPVAGVADVLLLPDIEAGNVLYKILGLVEGVAAGGGRRRRQRAGRAHLEGRLRRDEVQLDRAGGRDLVSGMAATEPRLTVISGAFGTGKTEIAINLALEAARARGRGRSRWSTSTSSTCTSARARRPTNSSSWASA